MLCIRPVQSLHGSAAISTVAKATGKDPPRGPIDLRGSRRVGPGRPTLVWTANIAPVDVGSRLASSAAHLLHILPVDGIVRRTGLEKMKCPTRSVSNGARSGGDVVEVKVGDHS
jgi:hypothetical protein